MRDVVLSFSGAIRKSALKNEFDLCDFVGYGHHDFNLKKLERLFLNGFFHVTFNDDIFDCTLCFLRIPLYCTYVPGIPSISILS